MLPSSTKEAFEKLSFTTLLVFYLFFCGSLYLVGFWLQFDVNVLPLITTLDIPKSFVQPFNNSKFELFSIFYFLIATRYTHNFQTRVVACVAFLIVSFILIVIDWSSIITPRVTLWIISFITAMAIGWQALLKINFKKYQNLIFQFIAFYPVACISSGYVEANDIKQNDRISIVENIPDSSKEYSNVIGKKLIGYVGDNVVFSSIDNNHYYILSRGTLPTIRFHAIKQ